MNSMNMRSGRPRETPAAQSLVAFCVYLVVLLDAQQELHTDVAGALLQAQSGLATFLVTSSLLLIPFIAPPGRFQAVGSEVSGDWRPTLLAEGLLMVYGLVLAIPWLRAFFSLAASMGWSTPPLVWRP